MKHFFVLILLLGLCPILSFGQFRILEEGDAPYYSDSGAGIGEVIFSYRVTYGEYPRDKADLLDFHSNSYRKHVYGDCYMDRAVAESKEWERSVIKNEENIYSVSGDTCSFYFAEEKLTIQCAGGLKELLKTDYDSYRNWIKTCCYDVNGRYLESSKYDSYSGTICFIDWI